MSAVEIIKVQLNTAISCRANPRHSRGRFEGYPPRSTLPSRRRSMLEIRDVTKTYPNGVQALRGITLTIGRGLFGLLGPNGAGKSSLMRTLATLQAPDAGAVT